MPFVSPWMASWVASVFLCGRRPSPHKSRAASRWSRKAHRPDTFARRRPPDRPSGRGRRWARRGARSSVRDGSVRRSCSGEARGPGRVLLAGGLAGWACMVNPQAASAALAALYLALEGRSASDRLRAIGAFAVGLATIVSGSTLLWLWSIGALPAAVDAVIRYNGVYVQINRQSVDYRLISLIVLSLGLFGLSAHPRVVLGDRASRRGDLKVSPCNGGVDLVGRLRGVDRRSRSDRAALLHASRAAAGHPECAGVRPGISRNRLETPAAGSPRGATRRPCHHCRRRVRRDPALLHQVSEPRPGEHGRCLDQGEHRRRCNGIRVGEPTVHL